MLRTTPTAPLPCAVSYPAVMLPALPRPARALVALGLASLSLASLATSLSAQVRTRETSNECKTTRNDPCTRSGTCSIQRSTWNQRVVCSRSDRHATMGWAGLCDQVHVGLVQGRCSTSSTGEIVIPLTSRTTAYVTNLFGMSCASMLASAPTAQSYNGRGINVPVLEAGEAVTGATWTAQLLPLGHDSAGVGVLMLRGTSLDPGVIVPQVGGMPMELLVDAPSFGTLTASHGGQGQGAMTFSLDLPRDPALLGLEWAAQGLVMSSHMDLSSAVRGTVRAPLGGN